MRPFRRAVWGCALVLLAAGTSDLQAAWCNVFQVTCWGCRGRSSVSASPFVAAAPDSGCCAPAPACCPAPACPQTSCTTRYVQRCFYQPVTTMVTRTFYEPVTTYRTSYFWEPVTSYRVSCYFDPCTCSYRQVSCPTTSYRLRSQCCPVQSFVQRCCSVPVTSYRQSFYYEPVTTCCTTQVGSPVACPPSSAPSSAPPAVGEQRVTPQPGVGEYRSTPGSAPSDQMPPAGPGVSFRQLAPLSPQAPRPAVPARTAPPVVKLERIVAVPSTSVEGQVVRADNAPQPHTRLLFVSADRQGERETVTADRAGQFRVSLSSGGWLVYTESANGQASFLRKIDVDANQVRQVTLVSR